VRKRNLIVIVGIILAACILAYLAKPGFIGRETRAIRQAAGLQAGSASREAASSDPEKVQVQNDVSSEQPEEGDEEETPTVEIPQDKQQLIGVKTTEVQVMPLQKVVRTVGIVDYDEKRLATVNTKFEGWIERLYVDYTGQYVKKGQPLAEIYSPELLATQQEMLNVLKWKGQGGDHKDGTIGKMLARDSEAIVNAGRQRLRLWDISDSQITKIEETGKPIRSLVIYSPVNGFVVQKSALQGMRVMPGEKLFDLADLSTVWIMADVYESDLSVVRDGQTAAISLSYFPGKVFTSRINYVYPAISGETRTAKVRFTIPNPGLQLKPQMYTTAEIKIDLGRKLAVPSDSVIDTGVRQVVYVDKGDGEFEPKEVLTGIRTDGFVEVLKGLRAGQRVATAANFLIDSEAQLKGVKPLKLPGKAVKSGKQTVKKNSGNEP
jgi:Cu(I)/Ag(I) efflux system membrane fusion protein